MANHNSKGSFGRKPASRPSGPRNYSAKPERASGEGKKVFNRNDKSRSFDGDRKSYGDAPRGGGYAGKSGSDRPYNSDRSFSKDRPYNSDRSFSKDRPSNSGRSFSKDRPSNPERSFSKDRPYNSDRSFSKDRPSNSERSYSKDRPYNSDRSFSKDRPSNSGRSFSKDRPYNSERSFSKDRPSNSDRSYNDRPARPAVDRRPATDDKPWVARAIRSEFGSVPRGGKGERNRSFKPEKEQYRIHQEENKAAAPQRDADGFAPREEKRTYSERPSNRTFDNDRSDRPARSFDGERKPYAKKSFGSDDRKSFGNSEKRYSNDRSFSKDDRGSSEGSRFSKERRASRENQAPREGAAPRENRFSKEGSDNRAPRGNGFVKEAGESKGPRENRSYNDYLASEEKRSSRAERPARAERPERGDRRGRETGESVGEAPTYPGMKRYSARDKNRSEDLSADGQLRLNRYIANAGICSRREADELIAAGEIKVNGEVITELGYKVQPTDSVQYGKKNLSREKLVYVLLNKPKDFITTTDDPEGRKTVMDLVANASKERIFPVGRLDRNTTGLLLFTNDGEIAQKLTHPSHKNAKIYQVELDKPITKDDFEKIVNGLELEDGKAIVDDLALIGNSNKFLGIEVHIGRNRIVRRIFESLGYEVVTLDRVQYAGLTKKDLPRGNWRFLNEKEVIRLKYFMK